MEEFVEIRCCECGQLLGVMLSNSAIYSFNGIYCYLCSCNIADIADILELTNVPGTQDLYKTLWDGKDENFEYDAIRRARSWRETIISWRNEQREISTKEKVDRLLAGRRS